MSGAGLHWTPDQVADALDRMRPGGVRLPVVGTANADDIPVLTDAVSGPGLTKPPRNRKRRKETRPYFQLLCALLRPLGIPDPKAEYRFSADRLWRFDFAWPNAKLALEIDGGLFVNGGHNRGAALLKQYEKSNAAEIAGWTILRYSPEQLAEAARDVAKVLRP